MIDPSRHILDAFRSRTKKSAILNQRAQAVLPGGDTRSGVFFSPYPVYMTHGAGTQVTDVDGNVYLDFLNNYTSLVHGHAHPTLLAAAREQLPHGSVYASPLTGQIELAELICTRVPGVQLLRFTHSGSEATGMAMRAARAYTGRDDIIRMSGSYHGSHDWAGASCDPDRDRGIAAGIHQHIHWVPYNDLVEAERALEAHSATTAAIVLEPVPNSGGIPVPLPGYLSGLRALADRFNVLLVFDEVVTLRLHEGGYQKLSGVTPDLTAMGKIIGGGYAVGAFGGRREIMQQYDPRTPGAIMQSGTFNGHAITTAAGMASLRLLDQPAIDRINALGDRLAQGFDEAFVEAGIPGKTSHVGSLIQVHWHAGPVNNMEEIGAGFAAVGQLPYMHHLALMNRGLFSAARGEFCISTVMESTDIDRAVMLFSEALQDVKPLAAQLSESGAR